MLTLLLPVDGSPGSNHAVEFAIKLYREVAPIDIRLLHVVTVDDGVGLDPMEREAGSDAGLENGIRTLSSARAILDRELIPYASEVRRGFAPATIIQYAATTACDGIIMGTSGMGTTDALLGSIARQVIRLSDVPVTLVK